MGSGCGEWVLRGVCGCVCMLDVHMNPAPEQIQSQYRPEVHTYYPDQHTPQTRATLDQSHLVVVNAAVGMHPTGIHPCFVDLYTS